MAKFDVYRHRNGSGYLLDLQADILSGLNTRFVAPLLPLSDALRPAARLNPIFEFMGERYIMVTQFVASVPVRELGDRVGSLISEDTTITGAIDMLLGGY
jgi:toxin CcdB